MGPGTTQSALSEARATMQRSVHALEPPVFSLENKLEYRENMETWIELVAQRATVDKTFKGICSGLALTVIGSLPKSQQEVVNAAIARGEIVKKHPSFQMQLRAVQQIMTLVAEDSPLEKVARVSQAFRNVSKCTREKGESLKKYAVRFLGLAQLYLRVSGAKQRDAAGMVLALSFLENANLQPETRNQIQLQLSQGTNLDPVQLSNRSFTCDDYREVDNFAENNPQFDAGGVHPDALGGIGVLEPSVLMARDALIRRCKNDDMYRVPDNLFSGPESPVPVFTIDEVYLIFSRMPELPQEHDDQVTGRQLKAFMASVRKESAAAQSNVQVGTANPNPSNNNGKRSREDFQGECGRCFSFYHDWDSCPMKSLKCDACGRTGHESWICYGKADVDLSDRQARLRWARARAEEKGLRERQHQPQPPQWNSASRSAGAPSSAAGSAAPPGKVPHDGAEKASSLFAKRRQG